MASLTDKPKAAPATELKRRIVVEESEGGAFIATLVRCEVLTPRHVAAIARAITKQSHIDYLQRKINKQKEAADA